MDVTEKVSLVSRPPTEEVVTQEELLELFKTNSKPKHYIGIEISVTRIIFFSSIGNTFYQNHQTKLMKLMMDFSAFQI